jgi:hypothetical protein
MTIGVGDEGTNHTVLLRFGLLPLVVAGRGEGGYTWAVVVAFTVLYERGVPKRILIVDDNQTVRDPLPSGGKQAPMSTIDPEFDLIRLDSSENVGGE